MVIMGVDLGAARTGIAVCDAGESFAFPKEVISEKNQKRLIEKIADCSRKYGAGLIVVGHPKNMDGSEGSKADECRLTAELIGEASGIETVLFDERVTTVIAHSQLNDVNIRGDRRKQLVDSVAATVLLEDYLRYRKNVKPD